MKARFAVVALLALAMASSAEAGIFSHSSSNKPKLPKPYSPVVDGPLHEDNKMGHKAFPYSDLNKKYNDQMWGANYKRWLYPDQNYQTPHWAEY